MRLTFQRIVCVRLNRWYIYVPLHRQSFPLAVYREQQTDHIRSLVFSGELSLLLLAVHKVSK